MNNVYWYTSTHSAVFISSKSLEAPIPVTVV